MNGWDDELDRFEASLAEQRRALAEGRPQDVGAFVPRAAGSLPSALGARARALSEVADALTVELTAATAAAARQLQLVTVMNRAEQSTSTYVDHRT